MKLLFFDIDGTLLSEKTKQVPASAKLALAKARANGHLVFINTGRPKASLSDTLLNLDIDGLVCGCGTYIEYHGKELFRQPLNHDFCQEIVKHLEENHVPALLEGTNGVYYDPDNKNPIIARIKNDYQEQGLDTTKTWHQQDLAFEKLTVWFNPESKQKSFMDWITQYFTAIHRGSDFYEFTPCGFSKASGIDFLCDYFQTTISDTYAFGDSTNDLSMLTHVPNSIAMKNSPKEILDMVTYVTKDVDDDGIYHALEHFHLL